MSVTVQPSGLEGAEKVVSSEEMYRMGLEASIPGADGEYDVVSAHKWFNLAALQGNKEAAVYRRELMLEMTSEQISEAQRVAREWINQFRGAVATG